MALPGTVSVPIQFAGGLNSKQADFSLQQPYLETADNVQYNQIGQADKRTGFVAVSNRIQGGGNISAGASITTFNDELILLDGSQLYTYQQESDLWVDKGTAIATINDQIRVINTKVATQSGPDATSANGLTIYAWEDDRPAAAGSVGAGVRYSVLNNQTGTFVVSDQLAYQFGTRPKVLQDGYNFNLIYCASQDTIIQNTIPLQAPNTILPFDVLIRDGYTTQPGTATIPYDAAILNGSPLIAYLAQDGLRLSISTPDPLDTNTGLLTIGLTVDSLNQIWVSYSDALSTYVAAYTYSELHHILSPVLAPIPIAQFETESSVNLALIEGIDPGSLNLTSEVAQGSLNNYINNFVVNTDGYYTFVGQQRGVGLASKPFRRAGNIFVNTIQPSNLQATYFTIALTQGTEYVVGTSNIEAIDNSEVALGFTVVAKHARTVGGQYRTNGLLSQSDPVDQDTFIFAGQRKGPFTTWDNSQQVNLGVAGYSIQFNNTNAFNSVQSNNNLHLVGGIKKIYDGSNCVEDNFNLFPEGADGYGCSIDLTTGGELQYDSTVQNQYQYIVVYEWSDNYGQVQRSGPSVANTILTTTSGQGAILTGPTLRLTDKVSSRSSVVISIYRTEVNLPIFYKITDDSNPLVNDVSVDSWTFTDLLSDDEIRANENLYTGSQLGNCGPPSCSLIALYQQRLMINSNEDPGVVWFSQNKFEQDQYNTLPLDWNTTFVEGIDSREGNDITALGLVDSAMAIFKKSAIFILQGDGPNALATSGAFNDASLLVSDTGCSNQSSLCFITQTPSLPGGLLFKSPKGIYLLGRDESLTYIGAPVEAYNALTITSANLLAESNQVVFTTLEGPALVLNYFFNAWSVWTNLPAISATVWQDRLVILRANGEVSIQTDPSEAIYADKHLTGVVEPIRMVVRTPWIGIQGQQGYQAVYSALLLGTLQGPHGLTVETAYDYNPSITASALVSSTLAGNRWGSNAIWGSNGQWGSPQFANYQFQINVKRKRCQAIQFTFSDGYNPSFSQGFSLNGIVLECQSLPGPARIPVGNKIRMK